MNAVDEWRALVAEMLSEDADQETIDNLSVGAQDAMRSGATAPATALLEVFYDPSRETGHRALALDVVTACRAPHLEQRCYEAVTRALDSADRDLQFAGIAALPTLNHKAQAILLFRLSALFSRSEGDEHIQRAISACLERVGR